jgi:HD-like signal output (HDOD) protein
MVSARLNPEYGRGEHTIEDEDPGLDPAELTTMIQAAFNAPGYQPPVLPATAVELLQISRRPDVTFPVVARLIEKEPLLASQLLRIAQSPVYRRAAPIRSLEQAASLLGLRALADLFLQASLSARVFRAPGYEQPMNELRDHSVATAIIARLVCRETYLADEYAFLCGLLHDVGVAACIIVLADQARTNPATRGRLTWGLVRPVVLTMHEQASLKFGELWQLPADVRLVIGHHHSLVVGGMVHPLAAVVCIADSLAADLGRGIESEVDARQVAVAESSLNLSKVQIEKLRLDAERLLRAA